MGRPDNARLDNLLAALTLNVADEQQRALADACGVAGAAGAALLALDEFADGAHVGHLAEVLGLTHSGAVRCVTQLERAGLAARSPAADRRRVEVRLTQQGRRRARTARAARDEIMTDITSVLAGAEADVLEKLLDKLVHARVTTRVEARAAGAGGAWWCRTCDLAACGRAEGRCPAQCAAAHR